MIAFISKRLRIWKSDDGVAMVMVIGVGVVLTLLVVSGIALSLGTLKRSASDSDWNAALAAAYAGVEEYQSRLTDEPAYVKYGNPDSTFSNPSASTTPKVQLPPTTKANPAFGLGTSGTWAAVAGSSGKSKFRYEVDNLKYGDTGTIRLRSTGLVGTETRTIIADLRQKGFIDFLYFTDYEMSDPAIVGGDCQVIHLYEGRDTSCVIQFAATDVIGGPVHSNDTIVICGATRFKGLVTTGNPAGGYRKPQSTCVNGVFDLGQPTYSPSISMPATNTQIKKETRTDLTLTDVPRPGCLYTGPTKITFLTGGKMNVKSPWTKFTNVQGDPVTSGDNSLSAQCGSIAALQSAAGADVPVPANNVVYVQNIPLTGINSATQAETIGAATGNGSGSRAAACLTANTASPTKLQNNNNVSQNVLGFPANSEKPLVAGTGADASYGCRNGDVFIQGELSGGAVTVASENYVYVTGDIKYKDADTDMLGLIGNNAVWVYNPMDSSNTSISGYTTKDRRIDAAILSVAHTFTVQNYGVGSSRGTLTVNGAISQKFRGPVATTGGTGYSKNYVYDTRYRYTAPPKFLSPVTTTYGINVWVEVSPVFKGSGAYR